MVKDNKEKGSLRRPAETKADMRPCHLWWFQHVSTNSSIETEQGTMIIIYSYVCLVAMGQANPCQRSFKMSTFFQKESSSNLGKVP